MGMILKEMGRVAYVTGTAVGTAQTLYTNLTTTDASISHVIIHNTHTSPIVVTLCLVPDTGGVADNADINDEYWQQPVPASETYTVDIPVYFTDTGDTLQIYAATGSKINAYAMGFTMPDQS